MYQILISFCLLFMHWISLQKNPKGMNYVLVSDELQWEYIVEVQKLNIGVVQNAKMISHYDGVEVINGKQYQKFITEYVGLSGAEPHIYYKRKSNEGVFVVDEKYKDKPEFKEIIFPLEKGSEWISNRPTDSFRFHVESIESLFVVDRIYKDCLRISYKGSYESKLVEGFYYLAKDVGMIKEVEKYGDVSFEITLEKFKKNGKVLINNSSNSNIKMKVHENIDELVGKYGFSIHGEAQISIIKTLGDYYLKFPSSGGGEIMEKTSATDCLRILGPNWESKYVSGLHSGAYFLFKVKEGCSIQGIAISSGYYGAIPAAAQIWKVK